MEPAKIELENRRWLFIGAIAFFILAKLAMIFLPINALGMPRMGDDAFHYLWGGKQILQGYDTSLPALADIQMQRDLDDNADQARLYWRARVHFRTIGTHSPLYDLMMAAVLATGLSIKWAFAVMEAITAVAMGLAIGLFFRFLFGTMAAAVGLALLAMLVFPFRGLQVFAASELAFACTLMLWTYLLRLGEKANPAVVLLAGILLLGLHTIARVFLFSGVVAYLLATGPSPKSWHRPKLWHRNLVIIAVGLGLLTLAAQLLPSFFPLLDHAGAQELRRFDMGSGLLQNLRVIGTNITKAHPTTLGLFILALLVPFMAGRWATSGVRAILTPPVVALLIGISIPLALSLLLFYQGYPASIFFRIFIALEVLLVGIAAAGLALLMARERPRGVRLATGIGTLVLVLLMVGPWNNTVVNFLGYRPYIIDDKAVAGQLARLADGTTIFYLESDITLSSSLLHGGGRFGALTASMLFGTSSFERLVNARKPKIAALPLPIVINMAHSQNSKSISKRRLGLDFQYTGKALISSKDQPMAETHLWVTNPGTRAFELRVFDNPRSPPAPGSGRRITVPAGQNGWIRIDAGRDQLRMVLVEFPQIPGWIEGISIGPPRDHIRWPWKLEHNVAVTRRDGKDGKFYTLPFNIPALFKSARAPALLSLIRREDPVLSDDSGFVFLHTVFSARK